MNIRVCILICGFAVMVGMGLSARGLANKIDSEELMRRQLADMAVGMDKADTKIEVMKSEFQRTNMETQVKFAKLEAQAELNNKLLWGALVGIAVQLLNAAARIVFGSK